MYQRNRRIVDETVRTTYLELDAAGRLATDSDVEENNRVGHLDIYYCRCERLG